jgi:hypothetical protein
LETDFPSGAIACEETTFSIQIVGFTTKSDEEIKEWIRKYSANKPAYSVFWENCQHFCAHFCKDNVPEPKLPWKDTDKAVAGLMVAGLVGGGLYALMSKFLGNDLSEASASSADTERTQRKRQNAISGRWP